MEENVFEVLREPVESLGKELFDKIINLPKGIRSDNRERTGIQIVVRQPRTRNLVMVSVYQPSEEARFFAAEQTVRTESFDDPTSQVTACADDMKFAGCVSYYQDLETRYHVSVYGLIEKENTAIAIIILAHILNIPVSEIPGNIEGIGSNHLDTYKLEEMLPFELFKAGHYLHNLLREYQQKFIDKRV